MLAPYRHPRGSLDPFTTYPFTLRFDTSVLSPRLPLSFSLLYSLYRGSCTSYRAPRTPSRQSIVPTREREDRSKIRWKGSHRLAISRYPPLGRMQMPLRERLAQPPLLLLLVGVEFVFLGKIGDAVGSGVPAARYPILFQSKRWNRFPLARFVRPLRAGALTRQDGGFHERRLGFKGDIARDASLLSNSEGGRFLELQFRNVEIFRVKFTVEEFSAIWPCRRRNFQLKFYDEREIQI